MQQIQIKLLYKLAQDTDESSSDSWKKERNRKLSMIVSYKGYSQIIWKIPKWQLCMKEAIKLLPKTINPKFLPRLSKVYGKMLLKLWLVFATRSIPSHQWSFVSDKNIPVCRLLTQSRTSWGTKSKKNYWSSRQVSFIWKNFWFLGSFITPTKKISILFYKDLSTTFSQVIFLIGGNSLRTMDGFPNVWK